MVKVAGLAVRALDTGRVLMLQRGLGDARDPAAGAWEFPGGHVEPGETAHDAAKREWREETGSRLPRGKIVSGWASGIYRGYVYDIEHESAVKINRPKGQRPMANPDDPDQDSIETVAWWEPGQLVGNPAMRGELKADMWKVQRAFRHRWDQDRKYADRLEVLRQRTKAAGFAPGSVGLVDSSPARDSITQGNKMTYRVPAHSVLERLAQQRKQASVGEVIDKTVSTVGDGLQAAKDKVFSPENFSMAKQQASSNLQRSGKAITNFISGQPIGVQATPSARQNLLRDAILGAILGGGANATREALLGHKGRGGRRERDVLGASATGALAGATIGGVANLGHLTNSAASARVG